MVTIKIGDSERNLENLNEGWLAQQVQRRRKDGVPVCVTVEIQEEGIDLRLQTPGCAGGAGGGRPPKPKERQVLEMWKQHGLDKESFTPGALVSFLKQLQKKVL